MEDELLFITKKETISDIVRSRNNIDVASKDKNIPLLIRYSKEKDINAQILLRNYMMERLLERISMS